MHEEQLPLDEQDLESRVQAALDRLERGYFTDKGTFVPAALARDVHRIVPLRASSDGLLRYYDDGVYREDGEATAAFVAQCLLGDWTTTYRVREAVAHVRRTEAVRPLSVDPDDTDVIRARNGIVNLRTDALTPYTPENATIVQLPWAFRHDAQCPRIKAFLLSVFEGDEEMVSLVFEIAGYLCWSRNSLRKAILLYGTGSNGKSILLYLLKCLLGNYNVAAVPLQRLGGDDRFAPSRLVGRLANICGDVGPNSARDMSLFKQITGGDPIYAERKGKDGFEFLPGAVPVFSANEFPRSPDTSRAYVNRWIAVECTARFEDNAATEAELRALGDDEDEMEGFLAEAVRGAAELIERGDFESRRRYERRPRSTPVASTPSAAGSMTNASLATATRWRRPRRSSLTRRTARTTHSIPSAGTSSTSESVTKVLGKAARTATRVVLASSGACGRRNKTSSRRLESVIQLPAFPALSLYLV